jgi:hypothetical protein
MSDFIRVICEEYSSLSFIMDNKRARPFQLIAQSLHMIETKPKRFNATPNTITEYLKQDREVPEDLKELVKRVFTIIEKMIEVDLELFHRDHKFAPVEFVFFTYMIAKFPNLPIFHYQQRLLAMRDHVRTEHVDIKFNVKVFDTLKVFVDNMKYEFASNQQTTSHHFNYSNNVNNVYNISTSSSSRGKKRVRFSN